MQLDEEWVDKLKEDFCKNEYGVWVVDVLLHDDTYLADVEITSEGVIGNVDFESKDIYDIIPHDPDDSAEPGSDELEERMGF